MSVAAVVLWGFIASLALNLIVAASRGTGLTRMSITFMLGTLVSRHRDRSEVIGFVIHLAVGIGLAFLYEAIFLSMGRRSFWIGGAMGIGHALVVLMVLLPLLPHVHPRMASPYQGPEPIRGLEPPGFLALHYGRPTPVVTIVAHMVYGGILGAFL